jgi:hypothetical protein
MSFWRLSKSLNMLVTCHCINIITSRSGLVGYTIITNLNRKIFDRHDMYKKKKETIKPGDYIEINIGTEEVPRMIKIGKGTSEKERKELIILSKSIGMCLLSHMMNLKHIKKMCFNTLSPSRMIQNLFRQKLRQINPKLAPLVQKELKKMLDAGIIAPTRHSSWCSNLVVVRKKNGGIRLCIDFRNLNLACIKDNYPLPTWKPYFKG